MACASDPSGKIGRGCRSGMVTLRAWARREFGGGDLGCFNPKSVAGGVASLHADGRADDIAFNAKDPQGKRDGDRFFHWIIDHADQLGLQETLWDGQLWSCRNKHLGIRGPNIQKAAHQNHVHWGVGYDAADSWTESWLSGVPTPAPTPQPPPQPPDEEEDEVKGFFAYDKNGTLWFCREAVRTYHLSPKAAATLFVAGQSVNHPDKATKVEDDVLAQYRVQDRSSV